MLAALSQRARVAILGVTATALAFFVFGGARGGGSGSVSTDPESAVPRDAYLVATARLDELRKSPIYDVLLGKDGAAPPGSAAAHALGLGRVEKLGAACGFDPLSRVSDLAVAIPEEGDKGELGVAAKIDVTQGELSKCAEALAGGRGESASPKEVGHFLVLEDASPQASQHDEAARPRLAYGHGGLLVVGRGAWFDAMLAAADGTKPSLKDAPGHRILRAALTEREGFHRPTIVATALLPRALRDRIRGEMGAEVGAKDLPSSLMGGVLGVAGAGIAIVAGGPGKSVDAAVELVCDSADDCTAVEKLIQKKRFEWSKELMLRMVGLGPLLDSITVERKRSGETEHLRVTASANADALASTLERVLRFSGQRSRQPQPEPQPQSVAPPPKDRAPDETVPARPHP